jgi:CRISPR/Cas system-associated protein Cas10 (large subunit of type III CRISPR-Cas system)
MIRTCTVCKEPKDLDQFHKNGRDKEGNPAFRNDCKECYTIVRNVKKKKISKFVNNTKHRTGEISPYTVGDWKDVMLWFRGACAYCLLKQSRRHRLTRDHVVPVSKGGLTTRANVVPGCIRCNSSKSDRDLVGWYAAQRFYTQERMDRIVGWIEQ